MNAVKKLEEALKALERAEEREARKAANMCDWSDPAEKRAHIAEYKRKRRASRLPKPLVCPCCGEPKPNSRQWVVFPRAALSGVSSPEATRTRARYEGRAWFAVCRSCAMKHFKERLWNGSK